MDAQHWIIAQILIDFLIAALLLWFIIFQLRGKGTKANPEEILLKSEKILSEMRDLSRELDKNLEEKRELSRRTLNRLEEGLRRADKSFGQIQKILKEFSINLTPQTSTLKDSRQIRSSVNSLLSKGVSKEEIAQHLGISLGEIELSVKLQKQKETRVSSRARNL